MNCLARDERNSDMMLDIISGMSHICSSNVLISCYDDVSPRKNKKTFYSIATSTCGGHFGGARTAAKVLQSGFYWPTLFKDAYSYYKACDRCQRTGNISRRNEMPLQYILEVELFDVWG
ncbi:hypothetical protein GQ457_15G017800 [Hibiscus cannabinus]